MAMSGERPREPLFALVGAVFFLSGSAGLVYQVLWMRSLGLFFGSDMYGVSIILATFMGGLAAGSLVGGRLAERTRLPLFWYGLAELLIGFAALSFDPMLGALDPLLHGFGAGAVELETESRPAYQAMRVGLAVAVLLVPTTLMGATLPLIMRHFARSRSALGRHAAYFYALNTLGALCGTLAAGFLLLPNLGMIRSTLCAAAVNLAIGVGCIALGLRRPVERMDPAAAPRESLPPRPEGEARRRPPRATGRRVAVAV